MNKLKFAMLVNWICFRTNYIFTENEQLNELACVQGDISYNHNLMTEILSAMNAGRKFEAIKAFRTMSGFGLKESKDFIEMWMK